MGPLYESIPKELQKNKRKRGAQNVRNDKTFLLGLEILMAVTAAR